MKRLAGRTGCVAGLVATFLLCAPVRSHAGEVAVDRPQAGEVAVDRTIVRFYSPEMGGASQPRFVTERTLAFEARIEVILERPDGFGEGYADRHIRAALDHHVAEVMLGSLAQKLIAGSPPWQRPTPAQLAALADDLGAGFFARMGGRPRVFEAAVAEQLDDSAIEGWLERQSLAAWYIDRAITPILEPSDEQLREVFRTAAHPYRGESFEVARGALKRWFVADRIRVAESAFLQSARAHLRVATRD